MSQMKLQTPKGFRVAVFIDAANFEISLKTSNLTADYKKLIKFVEQVGEIVALRYYSPQFNDEFIDLRECEFAIKKPPKGGAHNNLSTAGTIYQKMRKKSR